MDTLDKRIADDQDFLYTYADIHTRPSTRAYRENFDRIFRQPMPEFSQGYSDSSEAVVSKEI